jgi:delta 1-pyrroline-5-carboxylate dehydrogenase
MSEYVDLLARVAAPANEGRAIPDPATGETVGYVREQSVADLEAAIAAAKAAQPAWATRSGSNCCSRSPTASMLRPNRSPSCSRASRASR